MKTLNAIIIICSIYGKLSGQTINDSVLVHKFSDAFALVVSEDESLLSILVSNNRLEFYDTDSLKFKTRYKVCRNAWLEKAFFYSDNSELYYDYGMQLNSKYKKININTGKKTKVKCLDVPKGCSYKSIKYCGTYSPLLKLKNKGLLFKKNSDGDIEVFRFNN